MKLFGRRFVGWDLFPLLWLVFLYYPIAGFFSAAHSVPDTLLFWGVVALFLGVYWRAFMVERDDERWGVIGWAVAFVAFLVTLRVTQYQSITFLIYGGALIGHQSRLALALWLAFLNCFAMLIVLPESKTPLEQIVWLLPMMFFTFVAAYSNQMAYQAQTSRRRVALLQAEKERLAADAERERIARDLHDLLGHTLSVIVLKSELAARLAEKNPARAAQEIREVEQISREALQEVRSAVRGYRGSGFGAELARAKVALDAAGVKLVMTDTVPELPEGTEASAAMLLREAVTNVVRHARASEVKITLVKAAQGYTLTVQDDGVGGTGPEGTGLNSMRERLRAMGGTLERNGSQGTRLVAFFPAEGEKQKIEGVEMLRV